VDNLRRAEARLGHENFPPEAITQHAFVYAGTKIDL
jgi:hypothetical protein